MNEITFTVQLNDRDYDILERSAALMKTDIAGLIRMFFKPEDTITTILNGCREAAFELAVQRKLQTKC